ncbi:LCP family glycopolymer transferase [Bacillus alkalisoli]|uniref:LCP family glycopolymer transferase n=1 Tax=Bacillus alkalisoli TaxID=2011008 RepID=UPI000C242148|nr:LCP family protein [Bacillus alkalisoli]
MTNQRSHKNKKKNWVKISLAVFAAFFLLVAIYVGHTIYQVNKTLTQMHEPINREYSEKRPEQVNFSKRDPFSVLLIGIDKNTGSTEKGRSDSLIVLTVNPHDESMKMVSIPRDTRTEIIGRGTQDKINHAHAFGGIDMSIPTIENFLDIPIDYYVKVNMQGFKDIVDAVGGVQVNNKFSFKQDSFTFEEGRINLDGEQALAFARMRKQDPRGDFGRTDRQKEIVQGVINKGASFTGLTNLDSILGAIGQNVRTNLSTDEMLNIQRNYKEARHDLETLHLSGNGTKINGIYYFQVPEEERLRLSGILKNHLKVD